MCDFFMMCESKMSTAVRILSPETSTLFEMVGKECKHFALSHTHSLPTENVFFNAHTQKKEVGVL